MNRTLALLLALALIGAMWNRITAPPRPVAPGPGVHAPQAPIQRELSVAMAPIRQAQYLLHPQAEFDITARLLSRERYRWDRGASLSPIDWALGWGPMSDDRVLSQLQISQGARFFNYRWPDAPPIPVEAIIRSSANVHLIPANEQIWRQLERTAPGRIVRVQGLLVHVVGDDGFRWNSSLTREDTGAGACELLFVQAVQVLR